MPKLLNEPSSEKKMTRLFSAFSFSKPEENSDHKNDFVQCVPHTNLIIKKDAPPLVHMLNGLSRNPAGIKKNLI